MTLTFDETKKLYEKATALYNKIIAIKIRREIKVNDVITKYYSQTSRYANYGFNYYVSGGMGIHCQDIKQALEELKEYIDKREKQPKGYLYVDSYKVDALLDFIYNEDRILSTIQRINEEERKELDNLLG